MDNTNQTSGNGDQMGADLALFFSFEFLKFCLS